MGDVFVGWVDDPAECVPQSADPACRVTERFFGADYLTEAETAEMYRLVDAMPEDRCQADPRMECDPCLITTLEVMHRDHVSYADHCCGTQLSPGYDEAFEALVQFIERFAPEPG